MNNVTGMNITPRAAFHIVDSCTCSAGHKRRKRTSWAGPIVALLIALVCVGLAL